MTRRKEEEKNSTRKPFLFSIDTAKLKFKEDGTPEEIQVLMCGKWNHPAYGPIILTPVEMAEFKRNFDTGLRRDIPITEGHESWDEKPAVGWFKELTDRGADGLWATIEWTPKGKELLSERAYKYFSPEFYSEYEDPETREIYKNVLVGGALTNKPYFKKMRAVVLSEHSINSEYEFSDMNINDILAKKPEETTAEERAFLKEHKEDLSADQLAAFGAVLEDGEGEKKDGEGEKKTEGEAEAEKKEGEAEAEGEKKPEGEGEPKGDEGEAAKEGEGEGAGEGQAKVNASESMTSISLAEVASLRDMADKGARAFAELRQLKVKTEVEKLIFSEKNSDGKFLPKDEAKLSSFMLGLTANQRSVFSELVKAIPAAAKIFGEIGKGDGSEEASVVAKVTAMANAMVSADSKLKFSDAVARVYRENPQLKKAYEKELAGGKE